MRDDVDGSFTIKRTGIQTVDNEPVELSRIAAKTRHMPDEFITPTGNDVPEAFHAYARPLLGSGMARAPSAPRPAGGENSNPGLKPSCPVHRLPDWNGGPSTD
jgi:hypothetical protein